MIRVATRQRARLSACGQLSQVGRKCTGGLVHPESKGWLCSLPSPLKLLIRAKVPVLGGTDARRDHRAN